MALRIMWLPRQGQRRVVMAPEGVLKLSLLLLLVLSCAAGDPSSSEQASSSSYPSFDEEGVEDGSFGPMYSRQWAVHVEGGREVADSIAAKHGFINLGQIVEDVFHFHHNDVARRSADPSEEHHGRLTSEPNVKWAQQQVIKKRVKRDFMPFRPRSSPRPFVPNDPRWPQMWYLNRGGGLDMNVKPAWQEGITGRGVVVTILDDGLEKDHPDLFRNYDPEASFDVNNHDEDPMPRYDLIDSNRHGTRCAGEVAATANNSICAVGVAYGAGVGGVRMLDGDVTDAVEARSLSLNPQHVDIYSASWGPDDDGKTVDGPGELATRAFMEGVTKGRGGKGSIFVWASGNGGRDHDNCNCDGYTNAIWTLSISSATENGLVPWYSEACSSTLATTYSSGSTGEKQVVTTDLHHQCTTGHTGTSASAPLAAGICALALEANRRLTWRDMQHIVVRTAKPANLRAPDWSVNGVGRNVSHSFGYGLMDASAMVRLARTWKTVPEQHRCEVLAPHTDRQIPAKSQVVLQLEVKECAGVSYLEHVQAKISLLSLRRGDLQIHLTSPAGTRSTLLARRPHDISRSGFQMWPFMSVHSWGEKPLGMWQLEIHNEGRYLGRATLREWALIFHGTPENPDNQRPPTVLPAPHPPRRAPALPLTPSSQSSRPRGHPSGPPKKNKYYPRGRNGTSDSPLLWVTPLIPPPTTATLDPPPPPSSTYHQQQYHPPPPPPPTHQPHPPPPLPKQNPILGGPMATHERPTIPPYRNPTHPWGLLFLSEGFVNTPAPAMAGPVSRIADPSRRPPDPLPSFLGGTGPLGPPRPPPPRHHQLPASLPRGPDEMDAPGNHGIATLTEWNMLLHGTGTAPGIDIDMGGRPGEGNGIAARNSSSNVDGSKDKGGGGLERGRGGGPPVPGGEPGVVLGGNNGGLGRARWKQDGGTTGKGGSSTTSSSSSPHGVTGGQRNNNNNGFDRTPSLGGVISTTSSGCNVTAARGCIECPEGLVLHQGKCEAPCPPQQFYDNPSCLSCHYSCKSCSGPNDYECMECFEDATPSHYHTANQSAAISAFRCIPSDVLQALLSERWSFWLLIAFLCYAALVSFALALLCCQRYPRDHKLVERHAYQKLGATKLHLSDGQRREPESAVYVSSEDDDIT